MSYKTLLVHVECSPESDVRLGAAVALAVQLEATLVGVGGGEPLYFDNPTIADGGGMIIEDLDTRDRAELAEAETRFRTAARVLPSAAIWLSSRDYPDRALHICAARADLIVASAHRGPRTSTASAADLALRAGLPILTLPAAMPLLRTNNIVIAWKNTREARRAVSDALPLLIAADEVTVLRICPPGEAGATDSGLDDVVGRLKRHGVNAAPKTLERPSQDVFDALARFAAERRVDLIVAGAYGHSRLGEWMIGGVTQDLLDYSALPVLFSH
jgi:nucleotide-binding universal stress UspA family protein